MDKDHTPHTAVPYHNTALHFDDDQCDRKNLHNKVYIYIYG